MFSNKTVIKESTKHQIMREIGSISESEHLRTHPSPNPTLTLTCYHLIFVGLGEG